MFPESEQSISERYVDPSESAEPEDPIRASLRSRKFRSERMLSLSERHADLRGIRISVFPEAGETNSCISRGRGAESRCFRSPSRAFPSNMWIRASLRSRKIRSERVCGAGSSDPSESAEPEEPIRASLRSRKSRSERVCGAGRADPSEAAEPEEPIRAKCRAQRGTTGISSFPVFENLPTLPTEEVILNGNLTIDIYVCVHIRIYIYIYIHGNS